MKFLLILKEALNLFKNLLNDLRGKRSLMYLLILALSVTFAAGFVLYIIDRMSARRLTGYGQPG